MKAHPELSRDLSQREFLPGRQPTGHDGVADLRGDPLDDRSRLKRDDQRHGRHLVSECIELGWPSSSDSQFQTI